MFILTSCIFKKGIHSCDLYYVSSLTFFCFSLLVKLLIIFLSKYYQFIGCIFSILGHTENVGMNSYKHELYNNIYITYLNTFNKINIPTKFCISGVLSSEKIFVVSCFSIIYKNTELQ